MPVVISNKSLKFKHVEFHHLSFKNVNANDFDELYDAVNEYLFKHQAIIISSTIAGNRAAAKTIKKAAKKVFDEVNWPLNWIGNTKDSNLSGYFVAVSGVNVKVLMSSNFITKVFDTPDARYVYVGEMVNDANESKQQISEIDSSVNYALGMVGLSSINIVRSWYYCENPLKCNADVINLRALVSVDNKNTDNQAITETIVACGNQHQKKIMASFFALQTKNGNQKIGAVKGLPENMSAVILQSQNSKELLISKSSYTVPKSNEGSIENTIETVLNTIEALITDYDFKWSELWRSIAYFNDVNDMVIFKKICKEKQIPMSSLLMVQTDFYGEKNAFDIEADFVKINEE